MKDEVAEVFAGANSAAEGVNLPDLCTVEIVARYMKVSVPTLNRWAAAGEGPKRLKLGRAVRYRKQDVFTYLDAQAANASA